MDDNNPKDDSQAPLAQVDPAPDDAAETAPPTVDATDDPAKADARASWRVRLGVGLGALALLSVALGLVLVNDPGTSGASTPTVAQWLPTLDPDSNGLAPFTYDPEPLPPGAVLPVFGQAGEDAEDAHLARLANPDTDIPTRPRLIIEQYTVQQGDTIFGIAAKFNLKPDTILWGNPELVDSLNLLRPGKVLNILPIDGALRVVQEGDTLEKIAKTFHGLEADIIAFAGNDLDPENPEVKVGQPVIIPGGWRDSIQWQLPVVTRNNARGPGSSGEPGACGGDLSGPTGGFNFIWPAGNRYLSGWDYNPNTHPGLDIAAGLGAPIYASETGVVVFAGWSTRGYGNLVIIDHGNGWQTAYAHLSQINFGCGQAIAQGQVVGLSGSTGNSTGPHLHFEMRSATYGRVNPWDFLR